MADIAVYKAGETHYVRSNARVPYVAEWVVDLAAAATKKGSALAATDVIQALYVPAGSLVLFAGVQVVEEMTGTSTDATIDLGATSITDADKWVDGFDLDAASAGDYATPASAAITPAAFFPAADTIDVTIATQTGTITGGKLRVFAVLTSVAEVPSPGIAQVGS